MERQPRNLKSTLIEPFKQIKLGIYILGVSLGFIAISLGLTVLAFIEQYQQLMDIFNIVDSSNQMELLQNSVFEGNLIRISAAMAVYVVTLFLIIFWQTHRFYGPLVTIRRFIKEISQGNYTSRVSVRKNDELQSLVAELNVMAEGLEKKHGESAHRERRAKKEANDRRSPGADDGQGAG